MKPSLSMDSRLSDLYDTPVGYDLIRKLLLQMNLPDWIPARGPLSRMRLRTLKKLAGRKLDADFFDSLLRLISSEKDAPAAGNGPVTPAWWKEAVFYQIYPRSFMDSDGDGIGDLNGIISKLDYLKGLGVNALWLSPIFDSPNDDNGYDIRDYEKIMKEFGTMEDFTRLLDGVHARGMHLILDLVVNHTSDEHRWFRTALADPASKYRDYYFFRNGKEGNEPPNNWKSFFSGPAWNYYPEQKLWALHLFSKKQMDLNWDCPDVRSDVAAMVNRWLDRGVDGFRMDVINYISKEPGLPQGNRAIGDMIGYTGVERYFYGPHLHEYLHELHEKAFAPHHAFSVGETPGLGMKMSALVTGEERKELDMVFSFDQLETPGHTRFDDYRYDLNYYKKYITDWMLHYGNNCRMSLFYNNHDNPRMVSKVSTDPRYARAIETLLAVLQFTLKGTPFVFQGDEMGLTNAPFRSIEEIPDVESRNLYEELCRKESPEQAFAVILAGTRQHARLLLPWNHFPKDYPEHLIQKADDSVTEIYRELIALRCGNRTLIYGSFEPVCLSKDRFLYRRVSGPDADSYLIECNLSSREMKAVFSGKDSRLIFPHEVPEKERKHLKPYEARIWVQPRQG
jgi:oligo-1,6-glucosidase